MNRKVNGKNRKGLSSIVGGVFFLIIMVTGASYILYSMNQLDTFSQAIIAKNQQDRNKQQENFQITGVTLANNKFNVTVQNTGMIPINITRLWVENKTDPTWPVSKYTVNQVVTPGQTLSKIGQALPLSAKSTQAYGLTLVTDRGNSQVALVNSASVKPLQMQLYVIPDKVPNGYDTTLLFAVTNNMTNNGGLTNLQPSISVSGTASVTLVSGPTPSVCSFLAQGDTAYFKYIYSISGKNKQSATFTASLQNGYLGNVASNTVTVSDITAASSNWSTTWGILSINYTTLQWTKNSGAPVTWNNTWSVPVKNNIVWRVNMTNNDQTRPFVINGNTTLVAFGASPGSNAATQFYIIKNDFPNPGMNGYPMNGQTIAANSTATIYFGAAGVGNNSPVQFGTSQAGQYAVSILLFGYWNSVANSNFFGQNIPYEGIIVS